MAESFDTFTNPKYGAYTEMLICRENTGKWPSACELSEMGRQQAEIVLSDRG